MEAARHGDWEVAGTALNPLDARARGLPVQPTIDQLEDFALVDVATLWHSLEHIPDPAPMIRSVRDVYKRQPPSSVGEYVEKGRTTSGQWRQETL